MSATEIIDGKRTWTHNAKSLFDSKDKEMSFNIFQDGLRECGFRRCGGFACVERWVLKDTDLMVNVNTFNYTFSVSPNIIDYSILEGEILFPMLRERWKEFNSSKETVSYSVSYRLKLQTLFDSTN